MEKSQHRVPGKESLGSGHRIALGVALTLALGVAGLLALKPASLWPNDPVEHSADSECTDHYYSATAWTSDCTAVATRRDSPQDSAPAADAVNTYESSNSRQDRHANRAGGYAQSNSYELRPAHTMAELCSSGLDGEGLRCRIVEHDDLFTASESATARSDSGYTISGHVMTSEGAGLSEVTVVATPERLTGTQMPDADRLRFWTLTDSLGAYALDGLPDGEYTIRSGAQGLYQSARIAARAGVDYADLVVSRSLAIVAEGQVLSADGGSLEGVTVLPVVLGQPSVLTDNDGRFRLPVTLKPKISSFALRFQRPGFREHTARVELQSYGASNKAALKVVMHPVESWTLVSGQVRSESGEALAGRTVELRPQSAQQTYRTTTDNKGQYTFPVVESPADYQLIVFGGAEHKDHRQRVHIGADVGELDVIAESYEFGAVTGQLLNLNGEPVPDFDLLLRNTGSRKPNALVSTDEHGNFEIPAVPAGELVVASWSTPSILVQGVQLKSGDKLHLPLVLDWGKHEIRGVVVDAHGNPVPASRIVLQWSHQSEGITTSATRRTASDMQGHFVFSHLGPGPHSLRVNAPGFPTVNIEHDLNRQGYDLTVRLN